LQGLKKKKSSESYQTWRRREHSSVAGQS